MLRQPVSTSESIDKIRVLHVITGLGVGGAESMLAALVGARSTRLEHFVASLSPNGFYATAIRDKGTPVTELDFASVRRTPREMRRLADLVSSTRPQVVQGWMYHGNLAALAAVALSGRRKQTRIAWGIRCSDMDLSNESLRTRAIVRLGAPFARWSDLMMANSHAGLRHHEQLGYRCERTLIVHNGIDTDRYRPNAAARISIRRSLGLSPSELVVAHVARVHAMKDHATFLEAMRRVPSTKALVIGTGTDELPSLPNVLRLGRRSDIPDLLAACDSIVSSSAFGEGFSNAVAEGMSVGLVPVATDVGDARLIVADAGIIVTPKSTDALARAIESIAGLGPSDRAALGRRARERIQLNFSLQTAIVGFERAYEELAVQASA